MATNGIESITRAQLNKQPAPQQQAKPSETQQKSAEAVKLNVSQAAAKISTEKPEEAKEEKTLEKSPSETEIGNKIDIAV